MAFDILAANGLTKKVYGEISKAIPEYAVIQKAIKFEQRAKIGEVYEELILLSRTQNPTFQKTNRRKIYNLVDQQSLEFAPAQVFGCEQTLRDKIPYGMLASAERSGERAYQGALVEVLLSLAESARFNLEAALLYGGSSKGFGIVDATANIVLTEGEVTLTTQSWAGGIWAQMEKASVDFYDSTLTTKLNTVGPVVIESVDFDNDTLNVSGDNADLLAIVPGARVLPVGSKGETLTGMHAILSNVGTLFGIDAAEHSVWAGNVYDAGNAPATLSTFHKAMNKPVSRGLAGDVVCYVNPDTWADLVDDQTALRRFADNGSATKMVNGTRELAFYGVNGGAMSFVVHPMLMRGDAMIVQPKSWIRGGESELTNKIPGDPNEDFFHELPGQSGVEVRNFLSEFILCTKPSHQVLIENILPSAFTS